MPLNSNIPLNFVAGLFAGANVFRHEMKNHLDMQSLSAIALCLYVALRTGGDFNVRLNNALAIAIGMAVSAYACRALFGEPSASPKPF